MTKNTLNHKQKSLFLHLSLLKLSLLGDNLLDPTLIIFNVLLRLRLSPLKLIIWLLFRVGLLYFNDIWLLNLIVTRRNIFLYSILKTLSLVCLYRLLLFCLYVFFLSLLTIIFLYFYPIWLHFRWGYIYIRLNMWVLLFFSWKL